jgi:hypothetical protein
MEGEARKTWGTYRLAIFIREVTWGNRYDGEGLSFFKNSSGRNSKIWIYNCLNLIDLSLKMCYLGRGLGGPAASVGVPRMKGHL